MILCRSLSEARVIFRDGTPDLSSKIIHNAKCQPQELAKFVSLEIDRQFRIKISTVTDTLKSIWREVVYAIICSVL